MWDPLVTIAILRIRHIYNVAWRQLVRKNPLVEVCVLDHQLMQGTDACQVNSPFHFHSFIDREGTVEDMLHVPFPGQWLDRRVSCCTLIAALLLLLLLVGVVKSALLLIYGVSLRG